MNLGLFVSAALLVTTCSGVGRGNSEQLMATIEKQVKLPAGARSLREYARHYAVQPDGKVIGVYVLRLPELPRGADYGCEEIIMNGDALGSKSIPCPPEADPSNRVAAGESRWFDNYKMLPSIDHGGCMVVNVVFDTKKRVVEDAYCNGVA